MNIHYQTEILLQTPVLELEKIITILNAKVVMIRQWQSV